MNHAPNDADFGRSLSEIDHEVLWNAAFWIGQFLQGFPVADHPTVLVLLAGLLVEVAGEKQERLDSLPIPESPPQFAIKLLPNKTTRRRTK